jgi:hypothetical protein
MISIGGVVALIAFPVVTVGPIADQLSKRFATFNNIQQDGSYQARQKLYQTETVDAISDPIGIGFGATSVTAVGSVTGAQSTGVDSGVLEVPMLFGWVFAPVFAYGIIVLFLKALGRAMSQSDDIAVAGAAIFLVMLILNLGVWSYSEVMGLGAWIGIALALGPIGAASPSRLANRVALRSHFSGQGPVRET